MCVLGPHNIDLFHVCAATDTYYTKPGISTMVYFGNYRVQCLKDIENSDFL